MKQTNGSLSKNPNEKKQFASSIPVEVDRTFQAPVETVWKYWTSGDLIKQWWGPETFSCPEAKMDFREGGKYNFAMKDPKGKVSWSGGSIEEIIPMEKLCFTDQFTDKNGKAVSPKQYDMPGDWPEECHVTLTFEALGDNQCAMHLLHEGIPKDMHDDCVQGWSSSIDKLQKLVEQKKS